MKKLLVLLSLAVLTSCTTQPLSCPPAGPVISPAASQSPVATPGPAATPQPPIATPSPTPAALPHDEDDDQVAKIPGFKDQWSSYFVSVVTPLLPKLNAASADMAKRFCPKYASLSPFQQVVAWGYLASGVITYESGKTAASAPYFQTASHYTEGDGSVSQGLFQLTYGDAHCPTSKAKGDLDDALVNINCGMLIMAGEISGDGVVEAGGYTAYGAPSPKGAARYWSTLRVPDSKSQHHLADVIAATKKAPGCT